MALLSQLTKNISLVKATRDAFGILWNMERMECLVFRLMKRLQSPQNSSPCAPQSEAF